MATPTISLRRLIALPFVVLLLTRLGIELSVHLLPMRWAWLPAFGLYYATTSASILFANRYWGIPIGLMSRLSPRPSWSLLVSVVIPALLPLGVFVFNIKAVSLPMLGGIGLFALINPWFEESFWRGLLTHLPLSRWGRILLSAALFSFSHYFLWGAYWLSARPVLVATCVTTFLMGVCWMWFYLRDGRLVYPILSHLVVDVLNLSVAVFMGLQLATIQ
ncbi:CPBP family intramembrane metalloprotease [Fibrella sp. HMF5335]|uniref:CPBP family intramembrane metalloprotease n=1 Tax=Fibrella rubiginis TaxID=2817060 RepID=A0A939GDU6_9BACT|nr:CPBP family intramembrane glutamic endopeptidase [Fibrella rubiginis]MBO0935953.1 CPBP family intramembrane metalloprotease [Fibrella rubiginis]